MKIAVSAEGKELSCPVDERFGRTKWFIVVETTDGSWQAYPNDQNYQAAQGAGIQAAQQVVELGAEAVITGHVGPKAFKILKASGVGIFFDRNHSVAETIERLKQGLLKETDNADVEGHWA